MLNDDLLNTYLNDHLTGATAAIDLIKDCIENNPEGSLHEFLSDLLVEVKKDERVLQDVSSRVSGGQNPIKKAGAQLMERAERLKRGKSLLGYSDLRRMEELEALCLGVLGKRALWKALNALKDSDDRFNDIDFDKLEERAQQQYNQLERFRIEAAKRAFISNADVS